MIVKNIFISSLLIFTMAGCNSGSILTSEVFSPGSQDIFIITTDMETKTISGECKVPWPYPNHLLSRIGQAKLNRKEPVNKDEYVIVKSDEFCNWLTLPESNPYKDKNSPPRVECRETIKEENKDYVILDPHFVIEKGRKDIIVAGKENCLKVLRGKILDGYRLVD